MENQPTFLSPHRPWPMRYYNRAAVVLDNRGITLPRLRADAVMRIARVIARRTDFGSMAFSEPLERLLQSFKQDARLHPFGRGAVFYFLADLLANRIKIHADLQRYPGILDGQIRRPLFVLGLPRTGTTLLYNLLAQDPACRPLLAWESRHPSPPPQDDKQAGDPRIWRSRLTHGIQDWIAPALQTVHPMTADGPEECIFLTMNTMLSPGFLMFARLGHYDRWFRDLSFEKRLPAYQDYRRQLQLLQWRRPGKHWVLKSPVHLASLDTLFDVFPDACVVQTHRDPAKVVPSLSSMFAVIRGVFSDEVVPGDLGEEVLEYCRFLVERSVRMRETLPDRVLDLHYKDLVSDPIGTVGRIYDHFGYERSDVMDARMATWMSANPRHGSGVHRYDLSQFGLDSARIDHVLGPYRDRYAIN